MSIKSEIVPTTKTKVCEKCGGRWAWRQTKAGKWYPANATYWGVQTTATWNSETHTECYAVTTLAHSRFCQVNTDQRDREIAFVERNIEATREMMEMAAQGYSGEMLAKMLAKFNADIAQDEQRIADLKNGATV